MPTAASDGKLAKLTLYKILIDRIAACRMLAVKALGLSCNGRMNMVVNHKKSNEIRRNIYSSCIGWP